MIPSEDTRQGRWGSYPSVTVVIPALNEEECVGWVMDNIPNWVGEVVLVDGLSTDGTELVAVDRRHDLVIVHQRARGKGAALRAGFAAATGDIVVMIDADGSTDPREMGRFVDALIAGADFVKGSRRLVGGGSVDLTRLRAAGNRAFVIAANTLFGARFTDLCYGYCAFWREHLDALALTADGFDIEMELVLRATKRGLRVAEVPSIELDRRAGSSNLNAWADGRRVLRRLLRERAVRRPRPAPPIVLHAAARACHRSTHWVPAGQERRLQDERRQDRSGFFGGDDRRSGGGRRTPVVQTRTVLVAATAADAAAVQRPRRIRIMRAPEVLSAAHLPMTSGPET